MQADVLARYRRNMGEQVRFQAGTDDNSGCATVDPYALAGAYGTDAVRWWLLREVPRGADADFTVDRLVSRADDELASGFGNLVNRVVTMIHR